MVTKMRLKSTIQSPFSNHSVTIQSTERSDLTVSFGSSISLIEKKIISRHLKNILIPSICMFRGIQCHSYFVKHTAFVTLRVRPKWIMTYFYIHIFHFSSVYLFKGEWYLLLHENKENHLMFVYSMICKYVNTSRFRIDKHYISKTVRLTERLGVF